MCQQETFERQISDREEKPVAVEIDCETRSDLFTSSNEARNASTFNWFTDQPDTRRLYSR